MHWEVWDLQRLDERIHVVGVGLQLCLLLLWACGTMLKGSNLRALQWNEIKVKILWENSKTKHYITIVASNHSDTVIHSGTKKFWGGSKTLKWKVASKVSVKPYNLGPNTENKCPYTAIKSQYIVLITASLMCRFKGMDIDLKLFSGRGGRGLNNIIPFPVPVLSGD